MKLLVVSDVHERTGNINRLHAKLQRESFKPDFVVVAGDITYFKDMGTAYSILSGIRRLFGVKVLFVPGNCDPPELLEARELGEDLVNLHSRFVNIGEYTFYGVGGGGISPFNTLIEFTEEQFDEFISMLGSGSAGSLILVTHQPIYGFFDNVNGERIGSKTFATYLRKIEPILWITGHVHENSGWTLSGKTVIVHPGPLMRGYYAVVGVEDGVVKHIKVEKL
ncbi:MAG: metallophosphoesterase [Desulfurococcaceae archaeon]